MQELTEAQANPEVVLNENFETLEHQSVYGKRQPTTTGLTWGYYGGRWGGFSVADGTVSLSASATNYLVVLRSSGVLSASTSNTNWNDSTNYARVYQITTSASAVSAVQDHRAGPGGVHGQSSSVGGSGTELRGLTFNSDTGSTAASDPGNGLFKWNNATQGSATALYIDNQTADGVSLTTLWGALAQTGRIFIQQSTDADRWQQWGYSAHADGTGYRNFTVTLEAKSTNDIQDGVECYFDLDEDNAGGANPTESFVVACSDETTALTTGTAKVTFRMPYAFTLSAVRASVTTAPTGSTLIVDINESGSTILSTKLSIDATEKTSTTADSAAVISDASLADDAEMTIDIDQVGSTIAGAGLKVTLIGSQP